MNTELADLIGKVTETINWVEGEIPETVYQLLLWHSLSSFITFIVGLSILLWMLISTPSQGTLWNNLYLYIKRVLDDSCGDHPVALLFLAWPVIGIVAVVNINFEWLQIWVAPRVWLIEYSASLIK